MRVLVATANPGKAAEFARLLADAGWAVAPPPRPLPAVEETGATYLENAVIKARAAAAACGLPALADDSGIEVLALEGFPGLRSARWTSGDGPTELLRRAEALPPRRRAARMCAAVALAWPDGRLLTGLGEVDGRLAAAPRGSAGFGYDVIFELGDGHTLAEVPAARKDEIGHRGRALRALVAAWRERGAPEK